MDFSSLSVQEEDSSLDISQFLLDVYKRRKKSFLSSLQRILQEISSDSITNQLVKSKSTVEFISERVDEIIYKVLNSDRERFISETIKNDLDESKICSFLLSNDVKYANFRDQLLVQKVKELNRKVESLNKSITEKESIISNLRYDSHSSLFSKTINYDGEEFMDVIQRINVTDLHCFVKETQLSVDVFRKTFTSFIQNYVKVNEEGRERLKQKVSEMMSKDESFRNRYISERTGREIDKKRYLRETDLLKAEIKQKDHEMMKLEIEIRGMKTDVENTENIKKEFENLSEKLERQIEKLKDDLEDEKKLNLYYQSSVENLNLSNEEIQKELESVKMEKNKLDDALEGSNSQIKNYEKENSKLKKQIEDLTKQVHKLQIEVESRNETIVDLKESSNTTKEELRNAKRKTKDIKIENSNLTKKLKKSQENLQEEKDEKSRIVMQLENKKAEFEKMKKKYASLFEERGKLETKSIDLENSLTIERDARAFSEKGLTKSKERIDLLENELKERNKEINETKAQNESKHKEIQQFKAEIEQTKTKSTDEIDKLKENLQNKEEEIKKLEVENSQIKKENKGFCKETFTLSNEINAMKESIAKIQAEKTKLEKEKQNLIVEKEKSEQRVTELNNTVTKIDKINQSLSKDCNAYHSKVDTNTMALEDVKKKYNGILSELKTLDCSTAVERVKELKTYESCVSEIICALNVDTKEKCLGSVIKLINDYNETKYFVIGIIGAISDNVTTSKIVFPIPKKNQENIITTLKAVLDESSENYKNIKELLRFAKNEGYRGKSCIKAAQFIVKKRLDSIANKYNSHLSGIQKVLYKE